MFTMSWGSHELVNLYNHLSSGHFFDRDTMRFWRSRVTSNFKRIDDKTAYFITTERTYDNMGRKASIRKAELVTYTRESDGRECQKIEVMTVGEFNNMTLDKAKRVMKTLS